MKPIANDDELLHPHRLGKGYIYNDFSKLGASGKQNNVLHEASCRWLLRSNTKVSKLFFDSLDGALAWLGEKRGIEDVNWKRCDTCQPGVHRASFRAVPSISPSPVSDTGGTLGPFTEAEVEALLVAHLRESGYEVRLRLRVHSGIADVAAVGEGGHWLIEVKGEDKGGYGTAGMNFKIGIGQLLSRMTEVEWIYALTFPYTDDYLRVLKTFRGSTAFQLLNTWWFVVHRDGRVDRYDAAGMVGFVNSL